MAEVEKDLATVSDGFSARALAERVRTAQDELKLGGKLATRLKAIEADLVAKGLLMRSSTSKSRQKPGAPIDALEQALGTVNLEVAEGAERGTPL